MDVIQETERILRLRRKPNIEEHVWVETSDKLEEAIATCQNPEEIAAAINLDVSNHLPIEIKSAMYERWLELGGRTPETLREYAWHLYLHGPDWDDRAASLLEEAVRRESQAR